MSPTLFLQIFTFVFGMYGVQMLFFPSRMVTDHFESPPTPLLTFWIRGSSVTFLMLVYTLTLVDPIVATKLATLTSFLIGVLYPWNAKFGYLSPDLPLKYPMHYVPELLMLALTITVSILLCVCVN